MTQPFGPAPLPWYSAPQYSTQGKPTAGSGAAFGMGDFRGRRDSMTSNYILSPTSPTSPGFPMGFPGMAMPNSPESMNGIVWEEDADIEGFLSGNMAGDHEVMITPEPLRILANAVYYPNWHVYKDRPPSSLPLELVSHVFYSFAWLREDGTVYLSDPWADSEIDVDGVKGCLNAFKKLKAEHTHLKVCLSIGGGGNGSSNFAAMARDPSKVERFCRSAKQIVVDYGLDGVDIDWEHPSNLVEGQSYLALMRQLRRHLPYPTYILTTALPGTSWALQHIPLQPLAQVVDFINLMTYDFSGPWTDTAQHHAQLFSPRHNPGLPSCANAVREVAAKGFPLNRCLLGIPAYGRAFSGVNQPGQKHHGCNMGDEGTFEAGQLPLGGCAEILDEECVAVSCASQDGWVSYDNVETTRRKAKWARESGLAGVFFWTGTCAGEKKMVEGSFGALHGFSG